MKRFPDMTQLNGGPFSHREKEFRGRQCAEISLGPLMNTGYSASRCADYPAIAELLNFATTENANGELRYLRRC